ncbi:hypothetical protein KC640_03805, partial [Candidatus Dojkabacteria bacterium]|nr:hypothetical protein [Candidatus Dojkabacteria bacterium]
MSSCVEKNTPSNGPIYGNLSDLNHNLVRIFAGEHRLYLENKYEKDPKLPQFDLVVQQKFGEDTTTYRYYDLTDENLALASEDISRVDLQPGSAELCASTCTTEIVKPRASAAERWVNISGGSYLIFSESEIAPSSPFAGWPISDAGLAQLNTYRWYELQWTDTGGAITPPAALPNGHLHIPTPYGDVTLSQTSGDWDKFSAEVANSRALAAAFGNNKSTPLTLLHTSEGWKAYTGAVLGGAILSNPEACQNEFSVNVSTAGAIASIFPENACQGTVTIEEIGRRTDNESEVWNSLLTNPEAKLTWKFKNQLALPTGMEWKTEPWRPDKKFSDFCLEIPEPLPPEESTVSEFSALDYQE